MPEIFEPYLARWELVADGAPIVTRCSRLLPVRHAGVPAMLKVAFEAEERLGWIAMRWWGGDGAARVLAHDDQAVLLERVTGSRSLEAMVREGHDDEATRILCAAAARLHAPRGASPPADLLPLRDWFEALEPAAARYGGILVRSAATARALFEDPEDVVVLHGDLHHGNVLDGGPRGWLAIDPKRLIGERGFDFANILCNPEDGPVLVPERFARQVAVITEAGRIDRALLLGWTLAYAGLSAAWILDDGDDASLPLGVAELAAAALDAP
jgi:streptomycin 6-kinase